MRLAVLPLLALLVTGCTDDTDPTAEPTPRSSPSPSVAASPSTVVSQSPTPLVSPAPTPEPGTYPPDWLGTRVLPLRPDGFGEVEPTPPELVNRRFTLPDTVPALGGDGFAAVVETVPPRVLARSTWQPDCPVAPDDLLWVRLTFWGFDDARHTGELLLHADVAGDVVSIFRELYEARYPIEEMRITRLDELDAPPTGDGNNTGAFACRATVSSNGQFSQHAYGLAIDVNPFQNPYVKGEGADRLVLPELSSAYLDRGDVRAGMVEPDDAVVAAFAAIGWEWGGDWRTLKDYQHFSQNGT